MGQQHLTEQRFRSLELDPRLLQALERLEFNFCTPIQAKSLPLLLAGKDVSGQAQTGTGKTLAFLLACAQRLLTSEQPATEAGKPRTLILAPTRELAIQIHKDAEKLFQDLPLRLAICYGGKAYEQQKKQFDEPVDVLIGTPGRLIDFFKQRLYNFKSIEVMVLDEADRMFDMGFISDVRYMLRRLPHPEKRLNMLFSATMAQKVMELAYEHMNNAELIKIDADTPAVERIEQSVYHPANHEKIPLLLGLIKKLQPQRSIIFANTKYATIKIWEYLQGNGLSAAIISGDIHQNKREKLLKKFHDGEYSILVATDVASRGLHIPDVTHVFNYDLPELGEDYVHRIGRTARAGKSGAAISFACENHAMNLIDIESYINRSIPTASISNDLLVEPAPPVKMKGGRIKSGGRSGRGGRPGRGGKAGGSGKPGNGRRHRSRRGKGSPQQQKQGTKKAV
ncbi:MAG: DEAD/DEAH box helicase [Gammaproteobacteria bacterium]|nr:MAG: DEAD/DEAH box helicase [Gammaproteobacteria bacterium]